MVRRRWPSTNPRSSASPPSSAWRTDPGRRGRILGARCLHGGAGRSLHAHDPSSGLPPAAVEALGSTSHAARLGACGARGNRWTQRPDHSHGSQPCGRCSRMCTRSLSPASDFGCGTARLFPPPGRRKVSSSPLPIPGAVAKLVRRPRLDTLIKLHVDGRLDSRRRQFLRPRRRAPDGQAGAALARHLQTPRPRRHPSFLLRPAGPRQRASIRSRATRSPETEARRPIAPMSPITMTSRTISTNSSLIRRWVYTCAYFADDHMDLARAQAPPPTSST